MSSKKRPSDAATANMSVRTPYNWIGDGFVAELSGNAYKVWTILKYHANLRTGLCFPTYNTIMIETGIKDPKTVTRALYELVDKGHLLIEQKRARYRDGTQHGNIRNFYTLSDKFEGNNPNSLE